jgi:hypothetical protein
MSCRICYEEDTANDSKLISVCECSGSTGLVHEQCIRKWIYISKRNQCEICHAHWTLPEPDKCFPIFILFSGVILSLAYAVFLNYYINHHQSDFFFIITLAVVSNTVLVIIWTFLRNYFRKIAAPLWICIFLPLSIILQLMGGHIDMAIISYTITLSCHFVMALVSFVPGPHNTQNI